MLTVRGQVRLCLILKLSRSHTELKFFPEGEKDYHFGLCGVLMVRV